MEYNSAHTEDFFKGLSGLTLNSKESEASVINCTTSSTESSQEGEEDFAFDPPAEDSLVLRPLLANETQAKIQFISPKFWEGGVWKDSENFWIGSRLKQTHFSLLTYNVYFGLRNRRMRMEELGNLIKLKDPDFICLQEITPDIMSCLNTQSWCKLYFVSDLDARYVTTYGNLILSKIRMNECCIHPFVSKLGRKLVLSQYVIDKTQQLTLGTFHLESEMKDSQTRIDQFQRICHLAKQLKMFIFCGDTNFKGDHEQGNIGEFGLKDAWVELKQSTPEEAAKNPGLTFDTVENTMCNEEYKERDDYVVKRERLDRIYYSPQTLQPESIELVGNLPYYGKEWISDHYGLFATFKRL